MKAISLACLLASVMVAFPARAEVVKSDVTVIVDYDGSIASAAMTPDAFLRAVTCNFYNTQKMRDRYQTLFVFTKGLLGGLTNVQQGWPVKNLTSGIGRPLTNQCQAFCSVLGRLRQAVKMGEIGILPDDPDQRYTGIPSYALSGIELMAHEFGHQWLASITFKTEDGVEHCRLRGYAPTGEPNEMAEKCDGYDINAYNQHWSFYFNSGSVMYGSEIEDKGNGTFRITYNNAKYGPLDQYLMGLRLPEEVGPLFLVDLDDGSIGSAAMPSTLTADTEVEGVRYDFTIEDVIRSEGARNPALDDCHWKGALILVVPNGTGVTDDDLQKIANYANRFEEFYDWATDGRGSFDLTADGRGLGTPTCPANSTTSPDTGTSLPDTATVSEGVSPADAWEMITNDSGFNAPDWAQIDFNSGGTDSAVASETTDRIVGLDVNRADLSTTGCTPGQRSCSQTILLECDEGGASMSVVKDCATDGLICVSGLCALPPAGSTETGDGCSSNIDTRGTAWPVLVLLLGFFVTLARRRRAKI